MQLLLAAGATADGEALLTAVRMFPSRDVPARYRYRFDSDEDLDAFTSPEGAGYFACVDALLTAGADPNSTDSEGDSVLQFVAESGNLLMAKFLMQR